MADPGKRFLSRHTLRLLAGTILGVVLVACATHYQQLYDFNNAFERGDLNKALQTLRQKKDLAHGKSRFLYYLNNGLLLSILGEYEESNAYFEKAFLFGEDYRINYVHEAASYFTNPSVTIYRGEDHEHLLLLYYKALNFLKMGRPEDALIECRRLNIRLQQLSDRYTAENRYRRDAFIHNLMGIIYQSVGDYNNAFIAYRNALEVYEEDYARMFGMHAPQQLKKDLLNTAWWTGFEDEFESYKARFGMEDYRPQKPEAELVFFWHNSLGPIKSEWSINFLIHHGTDNTIIFTNDQLGISFPFKVEEQKDRSDLAKLEVFRVAFPRYIERPAYFQSATLRHENGTSYDLELSEDVNQIAFYTLKERMMQEFAKGLLRAAMKKVTEYSIRKEDDRLGALIGVVNALTEKADTRNWQTLPHSIYYARIPLKEGKNVLHFKAFAPQDKAEYTFTYEVQKGQTLFHTFSSLEFSSGPYRLY